MPIERFIWSGLPEEYMHAFQKKSKSGIKTPRADVELVETRLKTVLASYRYERD
jgi:phage-related protein